MYINGYYVFEVIHNRIITFKKKTEKKRELL